MNEAGCLTNLWIVTFSRLVIKSIIELWNDFHQMQTDSGENWIPN